MLAQMVRSASFSRRSKRASTDPCKQSTEVSSDKTVSKPTGVVGKLVRTASFSRRSKAAAREDDATDCSESRSATPDPSSPDASADDDVEEPPAVLQDRLYGWLKKQASGGSWNKRYFFVDETRGTLGYAKGVRGRGSKPSAVLPIADITHIEKSKTDPCVFVIKCPPIHLTVAAISVKERNNWIKQLELRAEVWRVRQMEKMPVADVGALIRQASKDSAKHPKHRAPAAAPPPSPPVVRSTDPAPEVAAKTPAPPEREDTLEARPAVLCKPATIFSLSISPPVDLSAGEVDISAGETPASASSAPAGMIPYSPPAAVAPTAVAPIEVAAAPTTVAENEEEEAPTMAFVPRPRPAEPTAPVRTPAAPCTRSDSRASDDVKEVNETVELYSDDDDDGDSPAIGSANRAAGSESASISPTMRVPAPVPLAAMISSDEEDDDDDDERSRIAMPCRANVVAALPQHAARPTDAAQPTDEGSDDEIEMATEPVSTGIAHTDEALPAPVRHTHASAGEPELPASEVNWDSDEEDGTADVAPFVEPAAMDQAIPSEDAVYDADTGPPPPTDPPLVMAAPGIIADSNFADDDWDDDDM